MIGIVTEALTESIQVSLLVFVMMIVVDLINVWSRGTIGAFLRKGHRMRQYVVAPVIGAAPGCVGAFTNVSLYMHGMITFGALVGSMAAVSGDEAFVMLAMIPRTAVVLFAMLIVTGIGVGWLVDLIVRKWKIQTCQDCEVPLVHPGEGGVAHYIRDHIWKHIVRRHLWRTFLWTFGTLLIVKFGMAQWPLGKLASEYTLLLLFLALLIGLIPESGPHLIFVSLYASHLVPFSVLFASSIVQDGHGLLPLLSYSVKDSIMLKGFNFAAALILSLLLFAFGL
jgi:hypothetical protein